MLKIEPRMVSIVEYVVKFFLLTALKSTHVHVPLKYVCPNYYYVGFQTPLS